VRICGDVSCAGMKLLTKVSKPALDTNGEKSHDDHRDCCCDADVVQLERLLADAELEKYALRRSRRETSRLAAVFGGYGVWLSVARRRVVPTPPKPRHLGEWPGDPADAET